MFFNQLYRYLFIFRWRRLFLFDICCCFFRIFKYLLSTQICFLQCLRLRWAVIFFRWCQKEKTGTCKYKQKQNSEKYEWKRG